MSARAAELLEQVKHLPALERETFMELLHRWETDEDAEKNPMPPNSEAVQIPDYAARLKERFPDGGLKGDPQEFWDFVRGDD